MKKVDDRMSSKKGFTLIELLAVIAILAILMLLVAPNILRMFYDAKNKSFIVLSQEIYNEAEKNIYKTQQIETNKVVMANWIVIVLYLIYQMNIGHQLLLLHPIASLIL